ncbi:MAG: DNA-processing protein DprA, partial [Phycisphaerae bacterium]
MQSSTSEAAKIHLRWALTDGVGPILFARILEKFGDAERALGAPATAFETIEGIGRAKADNIARARENDKTETELAAAAEADVTVICRDDPVYPHSLKNIPDAPIVLFVKGELIPTDQIAIAIVGSRRCSVYGSEQARRFGELLANAGFTVVSGLARGIDAFAHHGAVESGGRSIAVMGRGLQEIYPPENAALARQLLTSGAWISELPVATNVRATQFPARNRIIAGMTLGTLVVEAADRSGALITARLANEYNREVFVVPGRLQEASASGTNKLIRDGGGKLITCLEDILDELGDVGVKMRPAHDAVEPGSQHAETQPRTPALTAVESRVLCAISADGVLQDEIIQLTSLPMSEVFATLTALELKGVMRRLPGQR